MCCASIGELTFWSLLFLLLFHVGWLLSLSLSLEECTLAIESHHIVDAAAPFLVDGDGIAESVQDVDVLVVEEGGEEGREIVVDDGGDITQQARSFAGLPRGASKDVRFINLIWVGMCHPLHRQCQSLQIQGRGRYSFCFFCLLLPVLDFRLPTDMCTFMLQGRRLEHVRR